MNLIKFPGFGFEIYISKIAFNIGNITIYKYSFCIIIRYYIWSYFSEIK